VERPPIAAFCRRACAATEFEAHGGRPFHCARCSRKPGAETAYTCDTRPSACVVSDVDPVNRCGLLLGLLNVSVFSIDRILLPFNRREFFRRPPRKIVVWRTAMRRSATGEEAGEKIHMVLIVDPAGPSAAVGPQNRISASRRTPPQLRRRRSGYAAQVASSCGGAAISRGVPGRWLLAPPPSPVWCEPGRCRRHSRPFPRLRRQRRFRDLTLPS
jgi:hypothetical protein